MDLECFGAILGATLGSERLVWGQFGGIWGSLWIIGAIWGSLNFGLIWGHFGAIFSHVHNFWAHSDGIWGDLGSSGGN